MSETEIRDSHDAESRENRLRKRIYEHLVTLKKAYKLVMVQPLETFRELERANNMLMKLYATGTEQLKRGRGLLGPNRARFRAAFRDFVQTRRRLIAEISEVREHWLTVSRLIDETAREYMQLQVKHHPSRLLTMLKAMYKAEVIMLKPAFMIIQAQDYLENAHEMALVALAPDNKENKHV